MRSMLSTPGSGGPQPFEPQEILEPLEGGSVDYLQSEELAYGFQAAHLDGGTGDVPVDIAELSNALMAEAPHEEIGAHTTALFQLADIVTELNRGTLTEQEAFAFLEELDSYLDVRIARFNAIEDAPGEYEEVRSLLVAGLRGLKAEANRAGWLIQQKGCAMLPDDILQEAQAADGLIGQAMASISRDRSE